MVPAAAGALPSCDSRKNVLICGNLRLMFAWTLDSDRGIKPYVRRVAGILGVLMALVADGVGAAPMATDEDRYAGDADLRRFVDSMDGETFARDAGRIAYRDTWEKTLIDGLYLIAPRGAWDEKHPAWAPARKLLAETLKRELVPRMAAHRANVRYHVNQDSTYALTAEERRKVAEWFESPSGRLFGKARVDFARRDAWDLPGGPEGETQAQVKAAADKSGAALDALPDASADGKAMAAFLDSPLWTKLLNLQLHQWSDSTRFWLNEETRDILLKQTAALGATLRRAVAGIPPPSDKTYLGSVAMAQDRKFTVTVEHFPGLYRVGHYVLEYAPGDLHWHDIAALVPGIKPGESRYIFFDAHGHVGDRP